MAGEKADPDIALAQIEFGPISIDFDGNYGLEIFTVILIALVLYVGAPLVRRWLREGQDREPPVSQEGPTARGGLGLVAAARPLMGTF